MFPAAGDADWLSFRARRMLLTAESGQEETLRSASRVTRFRCNLDRVRLAKTNAEIQYATAVLHHGLGSAVVGRCSGCVWQRGSSWPGR
jgi:hypothetical protein